jgi:hypothetical protein
MTAVKGFAAMAAASFFVMVAGCATTGGNLTSSAEKLERSADALARDARDDSYARRYSENARQLAEEARDFRGVLKDRRTQGGDIRNAFEELSRDYHALRDDMDQSDSTEARADFRSITNAYLDIEREMSRYGASDSRRHAQDRDERDRY